METALRSRLVLLKWLIIVLLPVIWLAVYRVQAMAPGQENSVDVFYHVRVADTPSLYLGKTFAKTQLSIWRDHFHDKELLFHVVLTVLRSTERLLGLEQGPSFHRLAWFWGLAVVGAFVLVGARWQVPWLHVWALLLVAIAPFFTHRLLMVRPHNLAIVLMLIACFAMSRATGWRRAWIPFVLGWLFVLGYSNPHFVLLPVVVFAVLQVRRNWRLALALPALGILGLLVGLLIHPQVPNGFVIWRVQCIQVVHQIVTGEASVFIGDEMVAPTAVWILRNGAVLFLAPLVSTGLLVWLHVRSGWRRAAPETVAMLVMQLIAVGGCFLSQRAIEYACPFGLLSVGLLVRDLRRSGVGKEQDGEVAPSPRLGLIGVHLALLALLVVVPLVSIERHRHGGYAPYAAFGGWAERNLPPGTYVANINWSDFPMLFYSAPQLRYALGLDPMFGYFVDPERIALLEKYRTGQHMLTPLQARELLGARYIFVSAKDWQMSRDLYQAGYVIVFQDSQDGWVYDLQASAENRRALGLPP